jgi:pilus assembly protein CpaE
MQRHLKYFDRINLGKDRVKLIANRYLKKSDITIQDTEKALNYPIFRTLPNDYDTTMTCLNKGVPINEGAPRSQLNAAMKDLAKSIIASSQ